MIYIVEDDDNIRQLESYALKNSGYDTVELDNANDLFCQIKVKIPDLIILDIMLPGRDGYYIINELKSNVETADIPVIMVSAKSTEIDKVKGLDKGADDYIAKPFGVMEFISRVNAVLRRTKKVEKFEKYIAFGIELDDSTHKVKVNNEVCECTYKEYELLKYLLMNKGIVLSRSKIMNNVWGTDYEGESRTVDMHIKMLRKKLGESGKNIITIRNVGYKLDEK